MQKSTQIIRRSFLFGQIAIALSIGFCGTAYSLEKTQGLNLDTLQMGDSQSINWNTGTADQFAKFINQPFTAMTRNGDQVHLTLVNAEAGNSGPARPKNLSRSEGVSLIFKSDFAEDLAAQGHQSVWIWHETLGEFNVLLGAVPRQSGGYDIETILN